MVNAKLRSARDIITVDTGNKGTGGSIDLQSYLIYAEVAVVQGKFRPTRGVANLPKWDIFHLFWYACRQKGIRPIARLL